MGAIDELGFYIGWFKVFALVFGPLQTVQRAEVWGSFLLCSLVRLYIWALIISMSFGMLVGCKMVFGPLRPLELGDDVDWPCPEDDFLSEGWDGLHLEGQRSRGRGSGSEGSGAGVRTSWE